MKLRVVFILGLVLAAALAVILLVGRPASRPDNTFTLSAVVKGDEVIPGPGEPTAFGVAYLTADPTREEICWDVVASDIAPVTAVFIHRGDLGKPGPVVLTLSRDPGGCTPATRDLIQEMIRHAETFYVEVHNTDFPDGALRGQITR